MRNLSNLYVDGVVGIGTTSASAKLHIQGTNSSTGGIRIHNAGGNPYAIWSNNDKLFFSQGNGSTTAISITYGGNVGIGTESPGRKLSVYQSSSSMVADFRSASGNDSFVSFSNNASTADQVRLGSSSGNLILSTNYSERVRIDASGNLGVGTASPSQKLDVAMDTDVSAVVGRSHVGYVGFVDYAGFSHIDQVSQNSYSLLQSSSGYTYLNAASTAEIRFRIDNADKMRLFTTGNFAVGTTTDAGYKLDVAGNIRISGTNGYVYGDTTTTYLRLSNAAGSVLGYSTGNIALGPSFTYNSGGVERFRIQSATGYVGIGTNSPNRKLTISDTQAIIGLNATSYGNTSIASDSVGSFVVYDDTASAYRMVIKSNGNTLIGTTTDAGAKVHIRQSSSGQSPINSPSLFIENNGSSNSYYALQVATAGGGHSFNVTNAGNVGIGTTSPSYKLDVAGNASIYDLFVIRQTSNAASVADLAADFTKLVITAGGSTGADHYLAFQTQASYTKYERARFTSGGNLLIGTTTDAGYKLDVVGSVNTNSYYQSLGTVFGRDSRQNNFITYSDSTVVSNRTLTIGNATYLNTVFPNGNVGVGTTSPLAKLHVKDGNTLTTALANTSALIEGFSQSILQIASHSTGYSMIAFGDQDDGFDGGFIYSNASRYLSIEAANAERMRFTSTGNVLIGTTTDNGYLLNVNGDATINGHWVGRGPGSVSTNVVLGQYNLNNNVSGGSNTAIGYSALSYNTGNNNTAVGREAGYANTTGSIVAVGYQAGYSSITGLKLTAIGQESLKNATGNENTAVGYRAAYNTTTGIHNTALGQQSLLDNTTGSRNTSIGSAALENNTASNNTALGFTAGYSNTTGSIVAVGYQAGFNNLNGSITAIGYDSMYNNTSGTDNTSVGNSAMFNNTTGNNNTAVGREALLSNTIGISNVAIGEGSARTSSTKSFVVAIGREALRANDTSSNTAVGYRAAYSNTTGNLVAIGYEAGYSSTTAGQITAIGFQALRNSTGANNTAIGYQALLQNTSGSHNVGIGREALFSNTTGTNNIAIGSQSLLNNTSSFNTAIGYQAGYSNTSGNSNTSVGYQALKSNSTSSGNAAFGMYSLLNNTGADNTAIGQNAGRYNTTGSNNIFIGQDSDGVAATDSNRTFIGNSSTTSTWVGGNLLVGTTTDSGYKLNVSGISNFSGNLTITNGLITLSDGYSLRFGGNNNRIYGYNAGDTSFVVGGAERIRINSSSGNVGIGTTSPGAKLQISSGDNVDTQLLVGEGSTYGAPSIRFRTASTNYMGIGFTTGSVLGNEVLDAIAIQRTGNVGIGITSPARSLHVKKAGDNEVARFESDQTTSYIELEDANTTGQILIGTQGDNFKVHTGGSERLRIDGTGNVGIGTTSPGTGLHVVSGGIAAQGTSGYDANTSPGVWIGGDGTNALIYGRQSNVWKPTYLDSSALYINAQSGGNVGIGTTSPTEKLHVNGNGLFNGGVTVGDSSSDVFKSNGTTYLAALGNNVGVGTTSPNHKVDIYSNENVPLRIHRPSNANLDSSGAWGIGFSTRGDAITSTTDTRAGIFSYYNGNLFLAAANTSITADPDAYARLTVTSGGYIGLGTMSPARPIHVSSAATSIIADFQYTGASYSTIQLTNTGGNAHVSSVNSDLLLSPGTTERMRVKSNGNVLIGTTTDSGYKLNVNGTFKSNALWTDGSANAYWGNGGTSTAYGLLTWDTSLAKVIATSGNRLDLGANGSTFATIATSGNVGIGTTSPGTKLEVNGGRITSSISSSHTTGTISYNDANLDLYNSLAADTDEKGSIITFTDNYFNGTNYIKTTRAAIKGGTDTTGNTADGFLAFYTDSAGANSANERMRIDKSGNVGIGTTTPSAKLHVAGGIKLSDNQYLSWDSSNTRIVGQSGYLQLQVAASDVMRLTSGGNVLIGTTTDNGKKLQVQGDVFIKGSASTSSTKIFEVQNSNGTSIMDFRGDAYAFFGCGQGGGAASGFIFRYNDTSHVQFTGYNYGNGSGSYKPILLDTDLVGRGQGIYVNFGGTGYANPAPLSTTEFAVRGRTSDSSQNVMQLRDSNNTDKFVVRNDGAIFTAGSQGWTGTVSCPSNPVGQRNLEFTNGILTNVY